MLQVENTDGSWYAQFHDGSDANYVYFSESNSYVPMVYRYSGNFGDLLNYDLDLAHDQWLTYNPGATFGSGTAQEAAEAYVQSAVEGYLRASQEGLSGRYVYEDVTASELHWEETGDNQITVSCDLIFTAAPGQVLMLNCIHGSEFPEGTHTCTIQMELLRENGTWRSLI